MHLARLELRSLEEGTLGDPRAMDEDPRGILRRVGTDLRGQYAPEAVVFLVLRIFPCPSWVLVREGGLFLCV